MDRFIQRSTCNAGREPLATAQVNPGRRPGVEPPLKRPRIGEVRREDFHPFEDGDDRDSESRSPDSFGSSRQHSAASGSDHAGPEISLLEHETTIETSLPPVEADRDAIDEYETLKSSQSAEDSPSDDAAARVDKRQWVRGKSSIYVDAFNLALDTVLEDEAHLFDAKEMTVFSQWRALDYETQYLCVLFGPVGP